MVDGGLVGGKLFVVFNISKVRALRKGPRSRWRVRDERGEVDERPPHPRICLYSSTIFTQPFFTALLLAKCIAFKCICLRYSEYSSYLFHLHIYLCFIFCSYLLNIFSCFVLITDLNLEKDGGFLWRQNFDIIIMTGHPKSVLVLSLVCYFLLNFFSFLLSYLTLSAFVVFPASFVCPALISLYIQGTSRISLFVFSPSSILV